MLIPVRLLMFLLALVTGIFTSYTVFADESVYDRLDGKGPSKKKVDVIEWEGNLEVHAYPKGSLLGLSSKLDDRTKGKKVMVIGYRFKGSERLIRRAILGIPFDAKLKAFSDPSEKEFDKLAITNQALTAPWKIYKLDPAPAQWYPDGDERNEETSSEAPSPLAENNHSQDSTPTNRAPASDQPQTRAQPENEQRFREEGSINHFKW